MKLSLFSSERELGRIELRPFLFSPHALGRNCGIKIVLLTDMKEKMHEESIQTIQKKTL